MYLCISDSYMYVSKQFPAIVICGALSRKPYNVGEKIFFFLADLNSPDSKL